MLLTLTDSYQNLGKYIEIAFTSDAQKLPASIYL